MVPRSTTAELSHAVHLVERSDVDVVVVAYFNRLFRSLSVQREVTERVKRAGGVILAVHVGELRTDTGLTLAEQHNARCSG